MSNYINVLYARPVDSQSPSVVRFSLRTPVACSGQGADTVTVVWYYRPLVAAQISAHTQHAAKQRMLLPLLVIKIRLLNPGSSCYLWIGLSLSLSLFLPLTLPGSGSSYEVFKNILALCRCNSVALTTEALLKPC